jgi:hypothetical protein
VFRDRSDGKREESRQELDAGLGIEDEGLNEKEIYQSVNRKFAVAPYVRLTLPNPGKLTRSKKQNVNETLWR